jgi:competence protein ComEA
MKHSLATGKLLTVITFAFIFWATGCTRLPRDHSPAITQVESSTSSLKPTAINLNTASAAELEKLPGVGPVLAERIVTYRNENGRFRRAEHLMMVRGVSDRKFRELRSLVRVE